MSNEAKVEEKALDREWKEIAAYRFEIVEDLTLEFQGSSRNIVDGEGRLVEVRSRVNIEPFQ